MLTLRFYRYRELKALPVIHPLLCSLWEYDISILNICAYNKTLQWINWMIGTVFLLSANQKFRMYYFWWILRHSHTDKLTNWLLIMFKGFKTIYFQSFMRLMLIYKHVLNIEKGWRCGCSYCFKGVKRVLFLYHTCIKILAKYFQYLQLRGDEKKWVSWSLQIPQLLATWTDIKAHWLTTSRR